MSKGNWFLRKVSDYDFGPQLVQLKDGVNLVGRGQDNAVRCKSVQVSRKHCSFTLENGNVTIKDFKSFNGTYVGDTKVLPMRELGLINGDVIGLGAEASEPHCNYIYRLEFVPNIQHEENVGPSDSVHPSNDNYERSKTARDQLETIVAVTKEGAGCPTSDHTTVPRKSDPAEKSVDADDIGQEGWLKTAHLEASDTAKKRIATSPPPVPVKLPRRSDQGDKSINVSKTSITEEVSLRNRSSIDNGETMCVYSNEVVDDKLMNTNRVQNTKEDPVIIDISDPGLNPLKYVNMQRGTGIRENDNSIISNVSLMNSSIFSQAAEDVIEIGDSDDEFPCSQLFDSKEEPEELNRIKQEVKNDDSDVEIIEEECSFFEEHFSQNFRETSTPYKDCKVNISVKKEDCSEYVNNIKCSNTLNINPVVETVVIDDGLTPVNEADDVFPSVEAIVGTVEDAVNAISPLDSAVEQKVENKIQEEDNGLVVVKNSEGLEVKTPVPSTKKTEEIKGEEPKRFIKLCEALPLPTKKTSRVKDDNKGKGKSKKKTSEKETSLSKKKIVKERRLKLKELSSKEKSKTAENLTKVSLVNPCLDNEEVKKAPNCAKITERNRGCFLAETTNLNVSTKVKSDVTMAEKTTKGTKKTKQSSPRKHKEARKPLDGSRKDVREEALSNDGVEKTVPPKSREKKHTRRSKRINGSVESDKTKSDEVNTIDAKKNNNGKKSVQFRDENLVEVREYECEGVLNKIQFKVKDLALKKNDDAVLSLKKYTEGTPVTSMETIYDMCKWNVVWLEECKKVEGEPPVGDLLAVMVNREQFATFQEYQRSFITLQMYELWAATVQDCALNATSFPGFVSESEIIPLNPRSNKFFQRMQCCALVGKEDVNSSNYPKSGDFVIVQVIVKNEMLSSCGPSQKEGVQGQKNFFFNAFGYIIDHARIMKLQHVRDPFIRNMLASNIISSPGSKKSDQQFDSCVYFTLMIRPRDKRMNGKCHFRIKVIHNLAKDMRYLDALAAIPFSPLSPAILDPVKSFFVSPSITNTKLFGQARLNDSQMNAVLKSYEAVNSRKPTISLIHGPPGTGKTSVIISLILQILYTKREGFRKYSRPKILLCAPSNTAVDELVLRLMNVRKTLPSDMRFKLVRNGRKKSMHPVVADISTESLAERELQSNSNPESIYLELAILRAEEKAVSMTLDSEVAKEEKKRKYVEKFMSIQQQIIDLERMVKNGGNAKGNRIDVNSFQYRRQLRDTELRVLQCADIVATTLSSSFTHQMKEAFMDERFNKKFTCCIIDEATQATEPESLIPLLLSVDNFIMVGDPQQLPATVLSQVSKDLGLGKSLFARLYNNWSSIPESTVYKLDTQYRMHPEIARWPCSYFYSNALHSAPNLERDRSTLLFPYTIMTHRAHQDPLGETNTGECKMVCNLVRAINSCSLFKELSIGIIVPYQKQKHLILSSLSSMRLERGNLIMVQTIDSYQGQEKDVIVLSCVRTEGIGFLADPQRLNVALTRAKSSLIVVGNFNSLQVSNSWQSLLQDAKKRSKLIDLRHQNLDGPDLLNLVMKKRGSS